MEGHLSTVCALILVLGAFMSSEASKPPLFPIREHLGVCPFVGPIYSDWCAKIKLAICSNDHDCPRHQKCCFNGCGRVCVDPTIEKPGLCPNKVWPKNWICVHHVKPLCLDDFDCPGNHKCCRNKCGPMCVAPKAKPGVCPHFKLFKNLICRETVHPEKHLCSHDYDCPRNKKCCRKGCKSVCVRPQKVIPKDKPGECPKILWPKNILCPLVVQPFDCIFDKDCHGHQKCCKDPCRNVCKSPAKHHYRG